MKNCGQTHSPRSQRRGSALVFAMIALLVSSLIGASLLRGSFLSMQQVKREQLHLQANWLAESGCRRAISRLQADPAYTGEEWIVPAEQLKSQYSAMVTIAVSDAAGEPDQTITAITFYPQQSTTQFRITKRLTIRQQADTK
jgi:type II secretory pathway component PulK